MTQEANDIMISPQFSEDRKEQPANWPESPQVLLQRLLAKVEGVLLGKREVIRQLLTALLAGGHVLLEDVPGVGKTMLAQAMARAVGGDFKRIQFTADMLPADVVGGLMLDSRSGELVYRPGPIIANVVLADEINRTSPRTQSALLEAMEERSVTIEGKTRSLPVPFMLIATQNPLSFEGTNALPEAQLDRFMMSLSIGYPGSAEEKRMLEQYAEGSRVQPERLRPVISTAEWLQMQAELRHTHMHEGLLDYMVQVADASRRCPDTAIGLSPRALRDWLRAAQASAYMEGRGYAIPDDLLGTAEAVLPHRLALRYGVADAGDHAAELVRRIVRDCPLPGPSGSGAAFGRRGR
jgi:MoxR-like ATPase